MSAVEIMHGPQAKTNIRESLKLKITLLAFCLFVAAASPTLAQTVHDESTDGDLSGNGVSPTALTFSLGTNTVIGTFGENGNGGATNGNDGDFFTFNLAAGLSVDSISTTRTGGGVSFVGYRNANSIASIDNAGLDAGGLFGTGDISGAGNVGLPSISAPLGPGDHTFVFQETAPNVFDYSVSFNVVPEPSGLLLFFAAFVSSALVLRRRR